MLRYAYVAITRCHHCLAFVTFLHSFYYFFSPSIRVYSFILSFCLPNCKYIHISYKSALYLFHYVFPIRFASLTISILVVVFVFYCTHMKRQRKRRRKDEEKKKSKMMCLSFSILFVLFSIFLLHSSCIRSNKFGLLFWHFFFPFFFLHEFTLF